MADNQTEKQKVQELTDKLESGLSEICCHKRISNKAILQQAYFVYPFLPNERLESQHLYGKQTLKYVFIMKPTCPWQVGSLKG